MSKDNPKNELEKFVSLYGNQYCPDSDTYEKKPFDKPVKAGKNTPIYNAHSYHTKVPHQGIIPFIEHYTERGDVILDPFCGSGMTGVAAMLCHSGPRHLILNDLSPAAIHIAQNYCTPVNTSDLRKEFDRIKSAVKKDFNWLYDTYHLDPKSGKNISATIQYTIWSDVFRCKPKKRNPEKHSVNPDGCESELIFWDVAVDKEAGKVKDKFKCPNSNCGETWRKTELYLIRSIPVVTNYTYIDPTTKKKKRSEHPTTEFEFKRLEEIESKKIPYWYPKNPFDNTREMWRGIHRDAGISRACDFYTKRNLWAMAKLWDECKKVKNENISSHYLFLLTSLFGHIEKLTRYKFKRGGNSALSGTLYIGSITVEDNPIRLAENKLTQIIKGLNQIPENDYKSFFNIGSASSLNIQDNSIDYIFTDPPFGSNIFYADCSFLWESWLGEFMDESKEAVWNKSRKPPVGGKTLDDYKKLMAESFQEMYRVLKPNRWATVVFSNSDDRVWEAIQDAAHEAGFVIYGGKEFDKIQRSFKGVRGEKGQEKVISKDVLLNLHKPRIPLVRNLELKKIEDTKGFVLQQIRVYLQYLPPDSPPNERTVEAITRAVQRRVLEEGYSMKGFSANYVADVLNEAKRGFRFTEIEGSWYLSKSEIGDLLVRDEKSAILWLTNVLSKEPKRLDEIDPLWKQEKLKGGYRGEKGLQDILDDFFIRDNDGTYRVPDDHERMALKGQIDERNYRECERFLSGSLSREPGIDEKFNWIELLFRKEEWRKILSIEKTLASQPNWNQLPKGKDTMDRIRLTKAMLIQRKESVDSMKQKSLF